MNSIGSGAAINPYYGASNLSNGTSGGSGTGSAENNFDQAEAINDYTTKKQLEAKLVSGINQAAKSFQ